MSSDAPEKLYIVLEEALVVTELKREVDNLLGLVATLREENRRISVNRQYEQAVNGEIIDLLRLHNIPCRVGMDFKTWPDELKN